MEGLPWANRCVFKEGKGLLQGGEGAQPAGELVSRDSILLPTWPIHSLHRLRAERRWLGTCLFWDLWPEKPSPSKRSWESSADSGVRKHRQAGAGGADVSDGGKHHSWTCLTLLPAARGSLREAPGVTRQVEVGGRRATDAGPPHGGAQLQLDRAATPPGAPPCWALLGACEGGRASQTALLIPPHGAAA